MSEVKYTPGPWEIDDNNGRIEITGRPLWPCRRFGVEGEWRIAVIDDLSDDHEGAEAETDANALLIAAAPDLLDALKSIFSSYKALADSGDAGNWKIEDQPEGKMAILAISKAEGRS